MTSLYLSRLMLNTEAWPARRDLGNVYELHRTVMSAFPAELPAGERVLFRLEYDRDERPMLLVQSRGEPDWGALPAGYLAAEPFDPLPNPAVKRAALELEAGRVLRFRLRANPTVKLRRDGKLSNRVPLARSEQQAEWLAARAARHGFEVLHVDIAERQTETGRRDAAALKVAAVTFEGLLRVCDGARLAAAVAEGIGPAKAFGCGLLSLAPA